MGRSPQISRGSVTDPLTRSLEDSPHSRPPQESTRPLERRLALLFHEGMTDAVHCKTFKRWKRHFPTKLPKCIVKFKFNTLQICA